MTNFRETNALWNELSDEQSEKLVGGVGIGPTPGESAGVQGWFGTGDGPQGPEDNGLTKAGFTGAGTDIFDAGASGNTIIAPGVKS